MVELVQFAQVIIFQIKIIEKKSESLFLSLLVAKAAAAT